MHFTGRAGAEGEAVSLVSHEDRPLMAAIERLMNRKVESRAVEGFNPGTAPRHEQPREPRNDGGRRQQQPRHNNNQRRAGGNPQARGSNPQGRGGNPQGRGNSQPHRARGQQPQQQGRRRPEHARPDPMQANSAREDQIREARARMAAEGEQLPPRSARAPSRNSRQQRWDPRQDPRRSEPREPAYAQQPKPDASRPAPVVTRKRSFAGMVGALLGRKRENEE